MKASIIDGKAISRQLRKDIKKQTDEFVRSTGIQPGLGFLLVGGDPASHVYVKMKGKGCAEVGFKSITKELEASITQQQLISEISILNENPEIHGILVQMPLPPHFDETEVIEAIKPEKDVDGFHPVNVGKLVIGLDTLRPCTPAGIQELLIRSKIDPAGKHVVIVGRSNIVGKPVGIILLQKGKWANGIVTFCHSRANDLSYFTKQADILIVAVGKPEVITGDMIKKGSVVIDVGVNRVDDTNAKQGYRLVGDVHFESASKIAAAITPVPGGVGPMTIAMLLANTLKAAMSQHGSSIKPDA